MRNWLAHWLRKLATRLDGDLYFPVSPELKAAARDMVKEQFERHVDEAMTLGNSKVQPQGFKGQRVQAIHLDEVPYRSHPAGSAFDQDGGAV